MLSKPNHAVAYMVVLAAKPRGMMPVGKPYSASKPFVVIQPFVGLFHLVDIQCEGPSNMMSQPPEYSS